MAARRNFFYQVYIFSSPGRSPRRAIVLPRGVGVGMGVSVGVSKKFNVKVFYVMGKALSGELSCPCDRSYLINKIIINLHVIIVCYFDFIKLCNALTLIKGNFCVIHHF